MVGQIRLKISVEKSRIRETKNLLTDADSRINTILERLRDLSLFFVFFLREREKLQSCKVAKLQSCEVAKSQSRKVKKNCM